MADIPSVQSIIQLSGLSRGIGKIFTAGQCMPHEFQEVDRETQGLADALKLLAHTLEEDNIIVQARPEVQQSVYIILASAQLTLKDVELTLDQYSVIKKVQTSTGFVVQKFWSDVAIESYRILTFTRNGGDVNALRSMLMMHCNTITLATQAVQRCALILTIA